eukprot:12777526-Heterocapsa_arctica.AAC.1
MMALPPKAGSDKADDLRPLTILSVLYRLWARIQWQDLADWIASWIDHTVFGGIQQRSALDAMQVIAHLVERAQVSGAEVGGVSFDLSKFFDTIPRYILYKLLSMLGIPPSILQPWQAMHAQLRVRFSLSGG